MISPGPPHLSPAPDPVHPEASRPRGRTRCPGTFAIGSGASGAVLSVLRAAVLPGTTMAFVFLGAGTLAAVSTGTVNEPITAALIGFAVCVGSLIFHETAHLTVLRWLLRDPCAGTTKNSLTGVWIAAPVMQGLHNIFTALSGPLAGVLCCMLATLSGVPGWIAIPIALGHAVNLLPFFSDGRMVLIGAGQLYLRATGHTDTPPQT